MRVQSGCQMAKSDGGEVERVSDEGRSDFPTQREIGLAWVCVCGRRRVRARSGRDSLACGRAGDE